MMARTIRTLVTTGGLLALWSLAYEMNGRRAYLLPSPWQTAQTAVARFDTLLHHALVTYGEILLGLALGTLLGVASAVALVSWATVRRWLMPVLVVSQSIPVFALAPLLVLWLGYGLASKVAMATLIIYFPVASAFLDGLRRTDPLWLEQAQVMNGARWRAVWLVRLPAALPALASGLRVATAVAPIGAVVGEWVGSSAGLGYLMLQANARMQIDVMFAAMAMLAVFAVGLFRLVDVVMRRLVPWQEERDG